MKQIFAFLIVVGMVNFASAQKQPVTKSVITFQIKNMGINTGGSIGGLQADIIFDKDKPDSGSMEASLDANTIDTDNDMRDNHLRGEEFFDVVKYPKITMKSVSIKQKSGNNYAGVFNVTIKDKTKPVNVSFTYVANGTTATFKGSFKIQRTDFGVGNKGLVLGNDVTVTIHIETTIT